MMKDNYSKKGNTGFILIVISLCLIIASLVFVIIFFDDFKAALFKDDDNVLGQPTISATAGTPSPSATELAPPTESVTPTPAPTKRPDEVIVQNNTVSTRFTAPEGFERVSVEEGSFEEYLRNYSLKAYGTRPLMHDTATKAMIEAPGASIAGVFNIELINAGNLQGAAGSIIRLHAEYLRAKGDIASIKYELCTTPAFMCEYQTWIDGGRLNKTLISENKLSWCTDHGENGEECGHKDVALGDTDSSFRYYLQNVMTYSNVASLRLQMKKVSTGDMKIGDVFCSTSGTGAALMIVDIAVNPTTGQKAFIVAGGGNPATDIHVYNNTNNGSMNVWQTLEADGSFICGDTTFYANSLYRFD